MRITFITVCLVLVSLAGATQPGCVSKAVAPVIGGDAKKEMERQLADAFIAYQKDSTNPTAIIWYGRRMAYLGHYPEAIKIFTKGIVQYPQDARFYRHRGHRNITLRCFDKAIADLEKAAALSKNKPDETEPDGIPNAKNIPTSTLQSNTWYHLGLAWYLKGNYSQAAVAYKNCLIVSKNPDMYVATANWLYITLRQLKRDNEAEALLTTISEDMELIENKDYLRLLLLYKGQSDPELMKQELFNSGSSLRNASLGFGLGNYFLLKGNKDEAKSIFENIVRGDQWSSFGFIAAEAKLKNLK